QKGPARTRAPSTCVGPVGAAYATAAENGVASVEVEQRNPSTIHTPATASTNRTHEPATPPLVVPFMVMVSSVLVHSMVTPAISVEIATPPARVSVPLATWITWLPDDTV